MYSISTSKLPELSQNTLSPDLEKYFGKNSKKSFVDTYRQLKKHAELLVGGYEQLDELISMSYEENAIHQAVHELESIGVITPRNQKIQSSTSNSISVLTINNDEFKDMNDSNNNANVYVKQSRKVGFKLSKDQDEDYYEDSFTFITKLVEPNTDNLDDLTSNISILTEDSEEHSHIFTYPNPIALDDNDVVADVSKNIYTTNNTTTTTTTMDELITSDEHIHVTNIVKSDGRILNPLELDYLNEEDEDKDIDLSCATYHTQSPRALFISGCLQHHIPPITIALVRKNLTSTINLSHMAIGDTIAKILAGCLSSLPYLQSLNLSDNNLNDEGLTALIQSAAEHQDLEDLDISKNRMGIRASEGGNRCKLRALQLRDAEIDDIECTKICKVLLVNNNKSLMLLDLSNNLIGKQENLNVVKPSFETGCESLACLLKKDSCPIQKLILHWNLIRLDGAKVLCESIVHNHHLAYLDLSYNAIGRIGAEVLGHALMNNNTLTYLDLRHNSIDSIGCFVLCVGLKQNRTLTYLVLDGNAVGVDGSKMIATTIASTNTLLSISSQDCDFKSKSKDSKLNLSDPIGYYELDMRVPYERAIAFETLRMCTQNNMIEIPYIDIIPEKGTSNSIESVTLKRITMKKTNDITMQEEQERQELMEVCKLEKISISQYLQVIKEYDTLSHHQIPVRFINAIISDLNVNSSHYMLSNLVQILDPYQTHYIGINTLIQYLQRLGKVAVEKLEDLLDTVKLVRESNNTVFIPPFSGTLKYTIIEKSIDSIQIDKHLPQSLEQHYSTSKSERANILNHEYCKRLINGVDKSSDAVNMLIFAITGCKLYLEEAKLIYNHLAAKSDRALLAIEKVFLRVINPMDTMLFLRCTLGYDHLQIYRLKNKIGPLFNPLVGLYSGFYALDLSIANDRNCWKLLLRKSQKIAYNRKVNAIGDISQHGNKIPGFRNIHLTKVLGPAYCIGQGTKTGTKSSSNIPSNSTTNTSNNVANNNTDMELVALFDINTIPISGKIEFDFIVSEPCITYNNNHNNTSTCNTTNSNSNDDDDSNICQIIQDHDIVEILYMCNILNSNEDVELCANNLKYLSKILRKQCIPGAIPHWEPSFEYAKRVGEKCASLYNDLANRSTAILNTQPRPNSSHNHKHSKRNKHTKHNHTIESSTTTNTTSTTTNTTSTTTNTTSTTTNTTSTTTNTTSTTTNTTSTTTNTTSTNANAKDPLHPSHNNEYGVGIDKDLKSTGPQNHNLYKLKRDCSIRNNNMIVENIPIQHFVNKFDTFLAHKAGSIRVLSKQTYLHMIRTRSSNNNNSSNSNNHSNKVIQNIYLLEYIIGELQFKYFECRHLSTILDHYRIGIIEHSNFGSFRVELIVALFDRIIDVNNFYLILMVLSADEAACIRFRIGILNIYNPYTPEGGIQLDCSIWEERQIIKILVHLSMMESGKQFLEQEYTHERNAPPIPGWELNQSWFTEDGLPKKGVLSVYVYSGGGLRNLGCKLDYATRDMLTCLLLVKHRNIHKDILNLFKNNNSIDNNINNNNNNNSNNNKVINNINDNTNITNTSTINTISKDIHPQISIFANYHAKITKIYHSRNARNMDYLYQIYELNTALKDNTMIKWSYHT